MIQKRPSRIQKLAFAGLVLLSALWKWADMDTSPFLRPLERYSFAGSLFRPIKYEGISVAAGSKDNQAFATGSEISAGGGNFTPTVSVTDRPSGHRRWRTELVRHDISRSINKLLWSAGDQQVVSNDTEGYVTVFDARSGRVLKELNVHTYRPCVFSFVPGGLLLSERDAPRDPTFLALRSWPELSLVWRVPLDCWDAATGNTNAAGTLVAVALGEGRRVGVIDLQTHALRGPVIVLPGTQSELQSLSLRPDGQAVAGGLGNGGVLIWDTPSGQLRAQVHEHGDLVNTLNWSPSGEALASGGFGGCGWLRSECLLVTRFGAASPQSKVVWYRRFNVPGSVEWRGASALLLSDHDQVFTVASGLARP